MADPIVTMENMDKLEQAFPVATIKPGTDLQQIMYNAGQRSVIEYIRTQSKYPKIAKPLLDGIISYSPEGGIKHENKYNISNIYITIYNRVYSTITHVYYTIYNILYKAYSSTIYIVSRCINKPCILLMLLRGTTAYNVVVLLLTLAIMLTAGHLVR